MQPSIPGLVIEELVVAGGFSQVWRAWDPLLERSVALKVFRLSDQAEAELPYPRAVWLARFVAEARLLAGLDHPHLVRVDGFGRLADGAPYMRMPFLVANLRREIGQDDPALAGDEPLRQPRAVAPARAADILRQVCLGLAALHGRGIVHRDVKPTNLLLTEREQGRIKLCDLGMARHPGEGDERRGVWLGTPDYAAPEQMRDAASVDDRADVYSVGVLGYRLLAGRLPSQGKPSVEALEGVPAALAACLSAALAPEPGARPTALQLAAMLPGPQQVPLEGKML